MKWEVKLSGRTMGTGTAETFPDAETRKSMEKNGYKIYVDGKVYREAAKKGK